MATYANQKRIHIHKSRPLQGQQFLQVTLDGVTFAARNCTHGGLKLWLYLASNADGYCMDLSPAHVESITGISRATYNRAVQELIALGCLVERGSNTYDFYTLPPTPTNEDYIEEVPYASSTPSLLDQLL